MDELEYLLEELQVHGRPNFAVICASLDDLIEKSCKTANSHSNSFFGLQLKSHGVLSQIFESLSPNGSLVEDERVQLRLLVLLAYLLHDVRRLDFFLPASCASTLARFCFQCENEKLKDDEATFSLLKSSPIFSVSSNELKRVNLAFLGVWILTKMTLASLNSPAEDRFCDALAQDEALCSRLFACLFAPFEEVVRDRTAALLDALFTVASDDLVVSEDLISQLLTEAAERNSVTAFKFAVSLTGSVEGAAFLGRSPSSTWMPTMKLLLKPFDDSLQPLAFSCFVNLIDRVPEALLDELRAKDQSTKCSLLEELASLFAAKPGLLLALALTFSAYQNKTNAAVIKAAWKELAGDLCEQLRKFIESFLETQRAQKQRVRTKDFDQEKRVLARLQSALPMFD